jgi:transcriptional regulator with XRE-family HTH domain
MNQKPEEIVEQFIALRAKGMPYAEIATQLGVSRPTLANWSRKHSQRIANERAIEQELAAAKLKNSSRERLAQACALYDRVLTELDGRKLAEIPTDRLALLAYRLSKHIEPGPDTITFSEAVSDEHLATEGPPPPVITWKG